MRSIVWCVVFIVLLCTYQCTAEDEDTYKKYRQELEVKLYKAQKAQDRLQMHSIREQLKAVESIKTQAPIPQPAPANEEKEKEKDVEEESKRKNSNLGRDLKAKMKDFFRRGKGKVKDEL